MWIQCGFHKPVLIEWFSPWDFEKEKVPLWRLFNHNPSIRIFLSRNVLSRRSPASELKERRISLAQHEFIIGRRHYVL